MVFGTVFGFSLLVAFVVRHCPEKEQTRYGCSYDSHFSGMPGMNVM
ncbi:MAG TPA: hypothetical protein VN868_10755 [Terriglobales bacterium]|nr:hypothetical protein [Terriglobales bacterium]